MPTAEDFATDVQDCAEITARRMLREVVVYLIFYDPGNGDQTQPLGPFESIRMVDNHLIQGPRDPNQPLAEGEEAKRLVACYEMSAPAGQDWRTYRGWHLQSSYWKQAGLEPGPGQPGNARLVFPQFWLDFRLPPKERKFLVKTQQIRNVEYEVIGCKTLAEAISVVKATRTTGTLDNPKIEKALETAVLDQSIGEAYEITELPLDEEDEP